MCVGLVQSWVDNKEREKENNVSGRKYFFKIRNEKKMWQIIHKKRRKLFMIKKSYHILCENFWLTFWLEHNKTMHDACFLLVAFYSCCQKQVMSRVNNIISSIVNVLWLKKFLDKPLTCKRIFYRKCDKMSLICVDGNLMFLILPYKSISMLSKRDAFMSV